MGDNFEHILVPGDRVKYWVLDVVGTVQARLPNGRLMVDWESTSYRCEPEGYLESDLKLFTSGPHYPEHVKLRGVKDESQKLGAFLEWLGEKGLVVCQLEESHQEYVPTWRSVTSILAQYFEIDEKKLEAEKLAMLEEQRMLNK